MLEEAIEIMKYCDSDYCSDREAQIKSEKFKTKYQRDWTEVIQDNLNVVETLVE